MKTNISLFFMICAVGLLFSCKNDSTDSNQRTSDIPQSVDEIETPPIQDDPIKYWDIQKLKIQAGEEGYLRSTHTIPSRDEKRDPNPINVTRKNGKILMIVAGDYDENGEIIGRTDFFFENEKLAYVVRDDDKIFINDGAI